jgi:hypothetical protein
LPGSHAIATPASRSRRPPSSCSRKARCGGSPSCPTRAAATRSTSSRRAATASSALRGPARRRREHRVRAGDQAIVDLTFTLGAPDPVHVDFGDPKQGAIDRYRPKHLAPNGAIIAGTVTDAATHERVAGAIVTVVRSQNTVAEQTSSDDQGRYYFDHVLPGTYTVSAYYSIAGRGQIEVRRSDISVGDGEAVVVPLWIELAKQ